MLLDGFGTDYILDLTPETYCMEHEAAGRKLQPSRIVRWQFQVKLRIALSTVLF